MTYSHFFSGKERHESFTFSLSVSYDLSFCVPLWFKCYVICKELFDLMWSVCKEYNISFITLQLGSWISWCRMSSVSSQPQFRYTQPPSKVLHLRNLPWECTEEELIELGKPFGKVVNTKCNVGANRNQAFIEFVSINCYLIHYSWLMIFMLLSSFSFLHD